MANLARRAADEIKKKNEALKRIRENNKAEEQQLIGGVGALGGAVAAALVDKKWGEGGEQAKIADFLPINAGAGVVLAGAAVAMKKLPFRLPIGMFGLGLACASAYRFTFDNVNFES
jgi:hypothetical protein